jgi:hypothetical protein
MAQQTVHATKNRSAASQRARQEASDRDDRMHDERLGDARTAVVRARRLIAEAERFLQTTN